MATIKALIEELQEVVRQHGENLEVVTKSYNNYTDEWQYSDGWSTDVFKFNEVASKTYFGDRATPGLKLIIEA